MRATLPLGRIRGIPIGAHWSALLGVVLLGELLALTVLPVLVPGQAPVAYFTAGALGAAALVLSLLAHELGHALVAQRAGLGVRRITLWLLGGVSELAAQPQRPATQVRIALVGPMVSLALAGVFAGAAWGGSELGAPALVTGVFSWLASVNVMLAVFNLLPGTPLDGGRVLFGMIWWAGGDRDRAARTAAQAGQFLGMLLAGIGFLLVLNDRWDGLWLMLVGWFLAGTASAERVHHLYAARLKGQRVADVMTPAPSSAPGWWTVQALVDHLLGPEGPRHRVLPVIDFTGCPTGLLRLTDLAAVDPAVRPVTPVRAVAHPLAAEQLIDSDAPLDQVLDRGLTPGGDPLIIQRQGHLVGVITASDLQRAVELSALRADPPTRPTSRPGSRDA
jgi:Zn-dependent protease